VQAASRLYFDKPVNELTLEEAAMLAGIIQGNVRQSPYVNMEAALRRRNQALHRMAEEGYITREQSLASQKTPIVTRGEPNRSRSVAPYFVEEIRRHLESKYGSKALYQNGLQVRTTLDAALQESANAALDEGLRRLDRRRGWRAPARNVLAEKHTLDGFKLARWDRRITADDIVPVLVTAAGDAISVRAGGLKGSIVRAGFSWTGKTPRQLVKPGDLVEARIETIDAEARTFTARLEQAPLVQGAMIAIENRTGRVLAMIGGSNFERSEFNRATQALRQVGSAFKPFVYAAAIDRGYTAASIIVDEPVTYPTRPKPYSPMNYDREFRGPMTLRRALELSRNIPAVKLMDALGPEQVAQYAQRMGITSPIPPYLPVALGAAEATLIEMTSAYSVFPNQGVRMTPYLVEQITDRDGNLLEENRVEPHEGLRADTAFVMTSMLRGVVDRGTAAAAASLDWPLGGKTGTTDDYTDAWFIGFDPEITVGVWIGLDEKKPIGYAQTGTTAALPIWIDIMKPWLAKRRAAGPPPEFARPGNIVFAETEYGTEAFIAGTQPGGIR
jgi:penicillin-binding protein 1A